MLVKTIRSGDDPRNFLEFAELRHEINKMSHPAEAEHVNYSLITQLALEIFQKNGIDLQTATYLTVAQAKLHGFDGFIDGCALINTLFTQHWKTFWPHNETARIDMLDWLDLKIGTEIRQTTFALSQLATVIEIEKALRALTTPLRAMSLKRVPKLFELQKYIENTRQTLEKRIVEQRKTKHKSPPIAEKIVEPVAFSPTPEPISAPVPVTEPAPSVIIIPTPSATPQPPVTKLYHWPSLIAGVLVTTLAFGFYEHYRTPQQPAAEQIALHYFEPLSANDIVELSQQIKPKRFLASEYSLTHYQQQLDSLQALSPLATRYYGDNLIKLANQLWPHDPRVSQLATTWQDKLALQRSDRQMHDNYYQARQHLLRMIDDLQKAEEQKRSITISQLKSALYTIQLQLDREIPLEELLRQANTQTASPILVKNINERFDSLLSQYHYLLQQTNS